MDQFASIVHSGLSFAKMYKLTSSSQPIFRKQHARTD